ncbi:uncharacterized protein LOC125480896 [Pyrus x bretschneideri]|uniref:uncharacterized protein LOC125480896 n=1 Tax=Pyrus x bretschneideri TaxID=225117 RepID=UPI002030CF64|nr:uncharacterized protein LOC125480896 [Pyrus x bretschneideri]
MLTLWRSKFFALSLGEIYFNYNNKCTKKISNDELTNIKWHPPDKDFVELNFDGSVAGVKAVDSFAIREHNEILIAGGALNLDIALIFEVEAKGLREGLMFALRKGVLKIMVEGDSKLVIQVVQGMCSMLWNLEHTIEDIKWTPTKFSIIYWNHIFREANFVTDTFACQGLLIIGCHLWEHHVPPFALDALCFDSGRNDCIRGISMYGSFG